MLYFTFSQKKLSQNVEVDNSMVEFRSEKGAPSAHTIKADVSPKMIQQFTRSLQTFKSIEVFSEETCKGLNGNRRT